MDEAHVDCAAFYVVGIHVGGAGGDVKAQESLSGTEVGIRQAVLRANSMRVKAGEFDQAESAGGGKAQLSRLNDCGITKKVESSTSSPSFSALL